MAMDLFRDFGIDTSILFFRSPGHLSKIFAGSYHANDRDVFLFQLWLIRRRTDNIFMAIDDETSPGILHLCDQLPMKPQYYSLMSSSFCLIIGCNSNFKKKQNLPLVKLIEECRHVIT